MKKMQKANKKNKSQIRQKNTQTPSAEDTQVNCQIKTEIGIQDKIMEIPKHSADSSKKMRGPLREEQFWLLTGGVLILAFVAFSFALYFMRSFMIPFVFSILLCAMVSPIEKLVVVRWKLPQWAGVVASMVTILCLFSLCYFFTRFAVESISREVISVRNSMVESAPEVVYALQDVTIPEHPLLDSSEQILEQEEEAENTISTQESEMDTPNETAENIVESQTATPVIEKTSPIEEVTTSQLPKFAETAVPDSIPTIEPEQKQTISTMQAFEKTLDNTLERFGLKSNYINAKQIAGPIREQIPSLLNATLAGCRNFISSGTLVLLFCIFILTGHDPRIRQNNAIYNEIEHDIQRYLNVKLLVSLLTGASVYIIFSILGLKMAFLFGMITFVLNFIPSIGSIIATILPMPIFLVTMPDITNAQLILAFFLPLCVQNFFGNILEPKLQGHGLQLHPVTLLLALGFWGVVWGPVGMLLSAPLTAAQRIILLEFKMTRCVAELMGGKLPNSRKDEEEKE